MENYNTNLLRFGDSPNYIYPLSIDKYYNIRDWMVHGAVSFKEQYPRVDSKVKLNIYKKLTKAVNSVTESTSKVYGNLDLNKEELTWEIE